MKSLPGLGAVLLLVNAGSPALGGEPACCDAPKPSLVQRFQPAGGWSPYGGGVLGWWPRCCFPCGGGPNDYCRRPLPRVCWPPYPPYFTTGPAANCPCPR